MSGRDPHETDRAATPLELLFDLTFATAFGLAATMFAQVLAEGRYGAAFLGFSFASFAICWAWVNFTWFASAYDTDDWIFRLTTMVQMTGVLVVTLGLPRLFASIEHGARLDNRLMVIGYVIMRVAMVFQWLRAAKQDPSRRRSCLTYAITFSIAQAGWVIQILGGFSAPAVVVLTVLLLVVELACPAIAERKDGGTPAGEDASARLTGTPWNAYHIVERYSCFAIIALGEGVVGAVAALSAVVQEQGWSVNAALVCVAGVGLTFGMWWIYYMLPSAMALHAHRNRAFGWAYGQMVAVTSIVAMGAGLRVAALFIEHKARIGPLATMLTVAIPVVIYVGSMYALHFYLARRIDPYHVRLLIATAVIVIGAVTAALLHVNMAVCLLILMLAPVVTVVAYEMGDRRETEAGEK